MGRYINDTNRFSKYLRGSPPGIKFSVCNNCQSLSGGVNELDPQDMKINGERADNSKIGLTTICYRALSPDWLWIAINGVVNYRELRDSQRCGANVVDAHERGCG